MHTAMNTLTSASLWSMSIKCNHQHLKWPAGKVINFRAKLWKFVISTVIIFDIFKKIVPFEICLCSQHFFIKKSPSFIRILGNVSFQFDNWPIFLWNIKIGKEMVSLWFLGCSPAGFVKHLPYCYVGHGPLCGWRWCSPACVRQESIHTHTSGQADWFPHSTTWQRK